MSLPSAEDMDEDDLRPRRRRRVDDAQAGDLDDENDADVRAAVAVILQCAAAFAMFIALCAGIDNHRLQGRAKRFVGAALCDCAASGPCSHREPGGSSVRQWGFPPLMLPQS